jgi:pimeloyl-ACP methyl ester carboxylesterase
VENILSKTVKVNGLVTHYFESGQGDPLIIVHGGGAGASAWKRNIAVLAKKYHVYAPDLPGFGLSATDLDSYLIPDVADFVNRFSEALGLVNFNLMGHSFGGGIAAHLALKYPQKVRKLVLVSSLCMGNEIAWWIRMITGGRLCRILGSSAIALFKGLKYLVSIFSDVAMHQPISTANIQIGAGISTFYHQNNVLRSQLPAISAPTLVMWGADDPIVPSAHAYAAGKLIPDCRVRVFANCGHSVYRDNIGEFSSELCGFLG